MMEDFGRGAFPKKKTNYVSKTTTALPDLAHKKPKPDQGGSNPGSKTKLKDEDDWLMDDILDEPKPIKK